MSRNAGNAVRGPTSALTEFLRSSGITPSTVARRAATQNQRENQLEAGPSTAGPSEQGDSEESSRRGRRSRAQAAGYVSDELDDPQEEQSPPKKQKVAEKGKGKGKNTKNAKKKKEDDDEYDEDEDAYTALSKSMWTNSAKKPAVGSFENCAICKKKFTVTKYTLASNDGTGFLCHSCAKSSGMDPFKAAKNQAPRKPKTPAEKRKVVYYEEKRFPTLVSICIDIILKHIDDIEAFGDIGAMNMNSISKAISKTRRLTSENAHLFYGAENTTLTLYDVTKLSPPAMITLSQLNPSLTSLRLDFCGQMSDAVIETWSTSLPNLVHLELLGPFLVRAPAWKAFFETHKPLKGFLITQSPRFDLECMQALVESSATVLEKLRLKEVGELDDAFLQLVAKCDKLKSLDVSEPTLSCSNEGVNSLLAKVGGRLEHLNLSNHNALTDDILEGIKGHVTKLEELELSALLELTDAGVAKFFAEWENGPLSRINVSRNPEIGSEALTALLGHSAPALEVLNLNGLKDLSAESLSGLANAKDLKELDIGWCRAVDDFVVKAVLESCKGLKEVKVWGCNKVEGKWVSSGVKSRARVHGIEGGSVA
ncbi:dna dependent atpase [Moniliophthora roreri MCA 2997]|uniref:Dna dependent atpase n=2 Tax=Moniliophthora roreri TaxID=221103 RepID=V2XQM9_MONRO|nr:dna dependent atpase [Moniliophthora roreri MCA 2997]KAI3612316.1 dna dependent atpase [Moniliophthora roreri]